MCNHSYMPIYPQNSKYPLISVQWHILYQYFLFQTLKLTKTCSEFLPSKNDAKIVIQIVNLFENTHQCLIYPWDKFPSVSPNAYSMTKYSPKIGEIVHVLDFQKKKKEPRSLQTRKDYQSWEISRRTRSPCWHRVSWWLSDQSGH